MAGCFRCGCYLALTGAAAFILGRCLPETWIRADCFPYPSFSFEQEGRIYEYLHIKTWQNKLPDMSRILPGVLPKKRLEGRFRANLPDMVRETCVAELIHVLLCVAGLRCLRLWPGRGGAVMAGLNFLVNGLYILIQRYNRPRLLRLLRGRPVRKEFVCEY
ncbi:MAG: glycosyl-4,4'-diaponeurosporenoate acyltransferase [Oscillibacter sp.]|nr:glycosyl-4,4'-diaponeurosporenoate acyltransferase [Oscillibacter sp.]